jgi:DNA repair protein RadC
VARPMPSSSGLQPDDCLESLVTIVGSSDAEIVVLTCIDHEGCVGENEILAKPGGDKTEIPSELLFGFAQNQGAAAVMVASKSSGPIECMHERDIRFTDRLRAYGEEVGVPLFEHVVIERDKFRLMSHSMGWASEPMDDF